MSDELALRGIIHDLSNALTVILGWAEEGRGQDEALRARALDIIAERARSAHHLARRAIGAETGREVAEVGALCKKLEESMQVAGERRHVSLRVIAGACAEHEADGAADLEQALQNLLFNAIAYAPEHSEVTLTCELEPAHFCLRVRDHGAGIPEAARAELFAGYSTREGGTGLGLLHSRRMAEARGGSLTLGDADPGAEFVLRWSRARPNPSSEGLAGAHVVLVEDDDAIAGLIELGLEARGAVVARAHTLGELEACIEPTCTAVLLDWSPVTGEPEAWQAVVRRKAPQARIIIVTGQPGRVTLTGVRILPKPFEVKELLAVLLD